VTNISGLLLSPCSPTFCYERELDGKAIRNEVQQVPLIGQTMSVNHVATILLVAYDSRLHDQILLLFTGIVP